MTTAIQRNPIMASMETQQAEGPLSGPSPAHSVIIYSEADQIDPEVTFRKSSTTPVDYSKHAHKGEQQPCWLILRCA